MTDETDARKLHIDDDWKSEAAKEKERLARDEGEGGRKPEAGPGGAPPNFIELINLIAMQAVIALGGLRGPGGETIPANPIAAQHYIDLLDVLQEKTKGNLDDDERRTLEAVLYELRMQYVQVTTAPAARPGTTEPGK